MLLECIWPQGTLLGQLAETMKRNNNKTRSNQTGGADHFMFEIYEGNQSIFLLYLIYKTLHNCNASNGHSMKGEENIIGQDRYRTVWMPSNVLILLQKLKRDEIAITFAKGNIQITI